MSAIDTHSGDAAVPFLVDAAGPLEAVPGASALAARPGAAETLGQPKEWRVIDLVFVTATVAFFVIAVVYAGGCERLKGGRTDA